MCPVDRKLQYGTFTMYYDMWRLSLDCGASYGSEHGYYGHPGPRGGRGPVKNVPEAVWNAWPIRQWAHRYKDLYL